MVGLTQGKSAPDRPSVELARGYYPTKKTNQPGRWYQPVAILPVVKAHNLSRLHNYWPRVEYRLDYSLAFEAVGLLEAHSWFAAASLPKSDLAEAESAEVVSFVVARSELVDQGGVAGQEAMMEKVQQVAH